MGGEQSKLKHPASTRIPDSLPAIKLPASASFCEVSNRKGVDESDKDMSRSRTGSTSSRSGQRHPIPIKTRRLIQSCFANPHEMLGRRVTKRACDTKKEFAAFFTSMDSVFREEFEEAVKMLLKKTVANIDFVDEVERLSEEFGRGLADQRARGLRADLIHVLADAAIHECQHLDSAVHRAHTSAHAFSLFATLVFTSVREGFYLEVRRKRRTSNSFSSGSTGSRKKKPSVDSESERNSLKGESPRSLSPESRNNSDEAFSPEGEDGFLKPPTSLISSRSF